VEEVKAGQAIDAANVPGVFDPRRGFTSITG